MTDTARDADIVLPATSQLEQVDLHKPYGHRNLQYNAAAIAPLGEAKSNWDVMRLLAAAMGYDEPWLRQSAEEVIAEVLDATRATNPLLRRHHAGTACKPRARCRSISHPNRVGALRRSALPDAIGQGGTALARRWPRRDSIRCRTTQRQPSSPRAAAAIPRLTLISGAAHHFVSSSLANQPSLLAKEGDALHRDASRRRRRAWHLHGDDGRWWRTRAARASCAPS